MIRHFATPMPTIFLGRYEINCYFITHKKNSTFSLTSSHTSEDERNSLIEFLSLQ